MYVYIDFSIKLRFIIVHWKIRNNEIVMVKTIIKRINVLYSFYMYIYEAIFVYAWFV